MTSLVRWFDQADAMVLASPVYFYGFPAQAKAVIDRCQPLWSDPVWRRRPKRPAVFISTCAASRRSEFSVIVREARAFANTIGFKILHTVLVTGLDRTDATIRLSQAERRAIRLGRLFSRRNRPGATHG
jgi:multimeric flavodoxin WrbA